MSGQGQAARTNQISISTRVKILINYLTSCFELCFHLSITAAKLMAENVTRINGGLQGHQYLSSISWIKVKVLRSEDVSALFTFPDRSYE